MYKQCRGDTQNDWLWLQSPAKRELREGHTHPHTHPETDTSTSWSEIQREISGHLAPHMSSVSAGIQAIRSKQQHMKETRLPSSLQPSSATLQIPQREMFASTHRRFSRLSVYEYVVALASAAKTAKGQWGWQKHYHYFSNHLHDSSFTVLSVLWAHLHFLRSL